MGGQVLVWVPILVAALGFIGVLGAPLIAAWREAQIAYRTLRAPVRADLGTGVGHRDTMADSRQRGR
ncbi:hypothetical protein [Nocardia sp. NPDC004860]|uniref:hypothetical protein n=1 Tax=Nocardia sp. NPDC004860 TaxID=3154557 RepID=UPI0033A85E9A